MYVNKKSKLDNRTIVIKYDSNENENKSNSVFKNFLALPTTTVDKVIQWVKNQGPTLLKMPSGMIYHLNNSKFKSNDLLIKMIKKLILANYYRSIGFSPQEIAQVNEDSFLKAQMINHKKYTTNKINRQNSLRDSDHTFMDDVDDSADEFDEVEDYDTSDPWFVA
jgi:hypothetical protein